MSEWVVYLLGWTGMYAPMALGAIGSMIGCAIAGQTAAGAMLDVEGGYGRFVGLSAMPSSQTIYGIVVMFTLQAAVTNQEGELMLNSQNAGGLFAIGVLAGLALLGLTIIVAFYILIAAVVIGIAWLLRWWHSSSGRSRACSETTFRFLPSDRPRWP